MIVIINCGLGNLGSIVNMLRKIGEEAIVSSNISDIKNADKLILPGVGTFDNGIKNIDKLQLRSILDDKVIKDKTPILGICLGMQLMTKKSEEGKLSGLGWIDATTIKFTFNKNSSDLKIPHMGWNNVVIQKQSCLTADLPENARFYFVHSYHLRCNDQQDILTQTHYGYNFPSMIQKENIFGTQFHPEKSHKFGMKLLKNFIELC